MDTETRYPAAIEWYRPEDRPRIASVLGLAAFALASGALLLALAWTAAKVGDSWAMPLLLFGALSTAGGPLIAFLGLRRVLRDETCLTLSDAGLLYTSGGLERFVAWEQLLQCSASDGGGLQLAVRGGQTLQIERRLAGAEALVLARRINHLRSKALLGLLQHS